MPRPFFETLRELRAGRTLEDLGDEMATLVAAVKATGKPAEIRLTLKIKPPKAGGVSYMTIEDRIVTKVPKLDFGDTIFFPTADNGLTRIDPQQGQLELRSVERPDPIVVDRSTGEVITTGSP